MYLHEVCNEDFVLIQADWTVAMTRQLIDRLKPSHVILHRTVPETYYYLYNRWELVSILREKRDQEVISDAIGLHESRATAARDAYSNTATAPDRTVVIQEGRVVGFYEKSTPHEPPATRGVSISGGTRIGGGGGSRGLRAGVGSWTGSAGGGSRRVSVGTGSRGESVGGGVGSVAAAMARPVSRSLTAEFPEQVPLQETHSLLVSLTAEGGTGAKLPLGLPSGATVDVIVQPNLGFVLDGAGECSLIVDDPAKSTFQFKLKATQLGVGRITVLAFHQQQCQGSITLAPTVVPATDPLGQRRMHTEAVQESVRVVEPDLSLLIFRDDRSGKPSLAFMLTALDANLGFHLKPFGPVDLQVDPLNYFQEFFKDIENLPLETSADKKFAQERLKAKGSMLFEKLIPSDLQIALWSLRKQIKSVEIDSQEPWIPWEICKLEGDENGTFQEGPFFCEAFAVTRWKMGVGMKPTLKLNNMALVLPRNSNLQTAVSEGDYVQSLANGGRKVTRVPATYLDVIAKMKTGEYDAWHFTGHGGFAASDPNRSVVVLEDRQLMPEDLSGVVGKNVGKQKPLVFLNACQIGRNALSLTGIGGWASQFVDVGAGAFVGAFWSVYDQPAHDFAIAFYKNLLGGMAIGKAVQEARLAIKTLEDPTWLAYTVFADPTATIM